MKKISAAEIASLISGVVEGNPEAAVSRPGKIETAVDGELAFYANEKYEPFVYTTKASILLVPADFHPEKKVFSTLIRVEDVYSAVAKLYQAFSESEKKEGISAKASIAHDVVIGDKVLIGDYVVVESGAEIGDGAQIMSQVYIGDGVKIGAQSKIYPGVRILRACEVGTRCIIHSNAVVGSDGFGFAPQADGSFKKIAQLGNVIVEDEVEIGANTVIDRASLGSTIIRKGAKLDNLIQVAHNVEIGKNTAIAAQAGIAGSTKLGDNVLVGGQAGFVGHITVADGAKIQAQTGIAKTIKEKNSAWYGSPALPYMLYQKAYAVFRQLPNLYKRINQMERTLSELEKSTTDKTSK